MRMAHGVGFGASGEIDDTDDVAIVGVVRSMETVNRHGTVPIQSARGTRLKSAILYCTTVCDITQWIDGTVITWLPATG
jgi:hypothetical protein